MGVRFYTVVTIAIAILVYPYLGGGPPQTLPPVNPDDLPTLPDNVTRSVLVVGGGIAGLTVALELAERGFDVTVKEEGSDLGGWYSTQLFTVLGHEFQLSSGFHAWFHNYHNFKRIRSSLGVDKYYVRWQDNHFAFHDYEWENIYSSGPWPLNLIAMIIRSPNLSLWTAMKAWRVSLDFILYNHKTVYEQYDHLTFDEWAEMCGVVPEFGDIWLKPGISASFNNVTFFSAAEFLTYSHFYFLSNAEAEHREYSTDSSDLSLIGPWSTRLKKLGVKFQLGKAVMALGFDQQSAKVTHDASDESVQYHHVILAVHLASAKRIISQSLPLLSEDDVIVTTALQELHKRLGQLPLAEPFIILKVWFDKQLIGARNYPIIQTPQHSPINMIVQLHLVEEQYHTWAQKTGGSVMEFHLYSWAYGNVSDDKVWEIISSTVHKIYPEIQESSFKSLSLHMVSGHSMASFANGTSKHRPRSTFPSEYGIPNLVLAGDWLHTDYPSALAERAVSTGIEAANVVLLSEGVRQIPLVVTTSDGPGML